jgi:hypothetical protein
VSEYVFERFSDSTRHLIRNLPPSGIVGPALHEEIINDLNRLLIGPSIWNERRFSDVEIPAETRGLIKGGPISNDPSPLNRLLLEAAYPEVFKETPIQDFDAFFEVGS